VNEAERFRPVLGADHFVERLATGADLGSDPSAADLMIQAG